MAELVTISNLVDEVTIPSKGITSRALMNDPNTRVVIFGFDEGEELSEHTAAMPAILHVLQGEAKIKLGEEVVEAKVGTWIHMPAHLAHTVYATKPLILLLTLLKSAK